MDITEVKKHREEWAQALESGEFLQGKNRLRTKIDDSVEYCCLGVACELFRRATGKGHWDGNAFVFGETHNQHYIEAKEMLDYFGLVHQNKLVAANDGGKPFSEIADMIRYLPIDLRILRMSKHCK